LKLTELKTLLKVAVVLGVILIIAGASMIYLGTEKMDEQKILFTFRFSTSSSVVSGKSYYPGGGPEFHLDVGDTVEVRAVHPPSGFNGSLSNVYFAVWESAPEPGSIPDELMSVTTLPATHVAKSSYLFFQLLSDEPLQDLASNSDWTGDFVYAYRVPRNNGLQISGLVAVAGGMAVIVLASYRFVKPSKASHPRRGEESTVEI
jgi:hypothetical protein